MEKNNKGLSLKVIVFIIFALVITGLVGYDIYLNINKKIIQTTNITKTEKEVTITDQGIAESVEKIYDATVIVEIMNGDSILGWGSGFVYKVDGDNGYIVTNYHVTDSYKNVQIEFTNGETVKGEVIGGDEYTDVSIVKIPSSKVIKVAELGESAKMNLGDTAFAVGTPVSMNFKFSVTRGIISGKDRLMSMSNSKSNSYFSRQSNTSESWYINLLQIDASINSGNSGGPLCNANGQVVGINNSKLASTEIENIGFAVPIEDVVNIAEQVITTGEVVKPYLGVSLTTVENAYLGGMLSNNDVQGTVVAGVEEGSPFDRAGIKSGDIVTKINEYSTPNYKYFKYYLYRFKVGDKVNVSYTRDGKEHNAEITLQKK